MLRSTGRRITISYRSTMHNIPITHRMIMNMNNSDKDILYDAIVVGLGGVGSFALRSLAKKKSKSSSAPDKPFRVLGLERFELGHELGSSHGDSRLFRHAYFEHSKYVPLCLKSTEMFQELCDWKRNRDEGGERKKSTNVCCDSNSHVPLLERCGVLVVSDRIKDGVHEFIQRCQSSAEMYDIPHEILHHQDLVQRFGHIFHFPSQLDAQFKGILEPGAGFVRPELALSYAIEDAIHNGAKIVERAQVVSIQKAMSPTTVSDDADRNILSVESNKGDIYHTRTVLISAGAWAAKLAPEWAPHLKVTRQIQGWFQPQNHVGKMKPFHDCPGWFLDRSSQPCGLYGFPSDPFSFHPPNRNRVKIALHGRDETFDPDDDRPQVSEEELNELKKAVKEWIPEAGEDGSMTASNAKACLYTMSPDGHFIFDRVGLSRVGICSGTFDDDEHVETENVWCVAGLSGHGFKMTPALGQAAADLIADGKTELPIDFLNVKRLSADTDDNNVEG